MADFKEWEGFEGRLWKEGIDVRDFIQNNYKPYDGDESFLEGPTDATDKLWGELQKLQKEERAKGGVLDMETEVVSSITAYGPGYISDEFKDLEQVVGLHDALYRQNLSASLQSGNPYRKEQHDDNRQRYVHDHTYPEDPLRSCYDAYASSPVYIPQKQRHCAFYDIL